MPASYSGGQLLEIKQLMMLIETQLFLLFAAWLTKNSVIRKQATPIAGEPTTRWRCRALPSIV